MMKALVYHHSVPRYLLCSFLSRYWRRRFFPGVAPFRLREVEFRGLEPEWAKGWVALKPLMCGICGSDLSLLRGAESLLLEPYGSFPCILGHEVLAEVTEAPGESGFSQGDRVVVEPLLSCEQRGLPLCRSCERGDYNLCENFTRGSLAASPVLGYNATVGGGMAEAMVAHPSRVFKVPESMSDEVAVLTDSVISALQPVLDNFPEEDEQVVVFGAGVIGQHVIRSLRALGFEGKLVAVARHGFQRDLALAGGADEVLMSPGRETLGAAVGAEFFKTSLGGGNLEGGADLFFDCVGGGRTMQEGLICLRARGRYVMVGTASSIRKMDISSLWYRSLRVTGSAMYGYGELKGKRVRTYELGLELLAGDKYPTQGLLTHTFAMSEYRKAFQTVFDKRSTGSCKVAFDFRE